MFLGNAVFGGVCLDASWAQAQIIRDKQTPPSFSTATQLQATTVRAEFSKYMPIFVFLTIVQKEQKEFRDLGKIVVHKCSSQVNVRLSKHVTIYSEKGVFFSNNFILDENKIYLWNFQWFFFNFLFFNWCSYHSFHCWEKLYILTRVTLCNVNKVYFFKNR